MTGTVAKPEGITNPPIDELLEHVDSKYALVAFSAARARQINAYNQQLEAGLLDTIGPLVDHTPHEKALSIAMHEISQGMLDMKLQEGTPTQHSDLDDGES
ncbi:DNA-directed RNA polymerase subunit omega [Mobiluncus mulieris]|uniref:DNA-directed RNA polymerase subunit omega n=2 Tax=Mobiluncus mulieris TaxID=2052 RepID=E0QRK2_9ACTO|nr:DNA-directed RNA polymerase subunit omega [Mobiluncus mulieris]EEJ54130.1 DNA-directed RNA polymerase, omega subunit [Mobiluncus mulieris ATCC 35243]EFM45710.1 DNA-directed RNA polymerase, omega subunit [Mobiluncus mulieris ATCC 35239]EFN93116.1 DNA-directed RNA polymerase, omega subunit [Mobiluncus mulieris FB024-16]MBB5846110.1 DNA-directed RNA polymerase subunit omega [Mobiluncus mulieris]MCU9970225.1 DNA-directed RNA polymerase subunit omega [Mobiluncus mulieris]